MDAGIAIKPVFDHYTSVILTSAVSTISERGGHDSSPSYSFSYSYFISFFLF